MSTTRVTLSIEEIDRQISELQEEARTARRTADEYELKANHATHKAQRLEELKALAIEVGTPVPIGRARINRKLQIAKFLLENGPQSRKTIIDQTGIPEGTINSEMRHRTLFVERPGNLWDVTDAIKEQYTKNPSGEWYKLTEVDQQESLDVQEPPGEVAF